MRMTRNDILARFKALAASGKILLGVGAGMGITAKSAEAGGADMLIIYNSGRYRMAGSSSLAGLLPYGDANQIVIDMAAEVLPAVKGIPVLAGICGTDPFRIMRIFLKDLKEMGFIGIQNFPTVGLIDGVFRQNLEETGIGYNLEVDMIRTARELDLLTTPYVFDPRQARIMAEAGADILVAHMGLTTRDTVGAQTALGLADCVTRIQAICDAGKAVNSGVLILFHDGPITGPAEARYIFENTRGVAGFLGASSIERFTTEEGIKKQTEAFKTIPLKRDFQG